ncbi:3-hydroxyacyl-CoA dehydrogenase NAD-binding domain-containing protein [Actinomadura spongiicola]
MYGGGRMGAGIAHAFLTAGSTVTVVESSDAASHAAHDSVRDIEKPLVDELVHAERTEFAAEA